MVLGADTHRKRKTVCEYSGSRIMLTSNSPDEPFISAVYCAGCKPKPADERPESCAECDDLRRRKAEKANKAAASKEKVQVDGSEERSQSSLEAGSSASVYTPDASPSKILSVGGRRGKQPPGAGRQLPRGIPGQTTSPPLQTDAPAFDAIDPSGPISPKKIKLKMRLSSDPRNVVVKAHADADATESKPSVGTPLRMKFKKGSLTGSTGLPPLLPKLDSSIDEQATPKRRRTSTVVDPVGKSEEADDTAQSSPERRRKRVESMFAESGDRPKRSQRRLQSISVVGAE
jgi:hypothetical protein